MYEDTIAAIATAAGEAGIGIIRVSGEKALPILEEVFLPASGKISSRRFAYGHVVDGEEILDEVMAVFMPGPKTYTGEDVAEIQCHGSFVAQRKILSLVLRKGARAAEPGEFTKRAFLNGRLDLSQAEAVMDLVKAKTEKTFDVALGQLSGRLSSEISALRSELIDVLVETAVNIDYPDEDIEDLTYEKLEKVISQLGDKVEKLILSAGTGKILRSGLAVSIIGKPNVGKSSLLNALLRESRAIVTEIPGTTRDTIEEYTSVRNIPVCLTDTAGIRDTEDVIERLGIEKSKEAFNRADLLILVLDASEDLTYEDRKIIQYAEGRKIFVLLNKQDLGSRLSPANVLGLLPQAKIIPTCLATGEGLSELEDAIESFVYESSVESGDSVVITNARHEDLLRKAKQSLDDCLAGVKKREALDILEIDIRAAYDFLGEILGETASDEIIDEIFSRFCLGK